MIDRPEADTSRDFTIDPAGVPFGMFRANGTSQNRPCRFPHASGNPQPFDLCLLAQDIRHRIVHDFDNGLSYRHFHTLPG
jgi:hypothetical protein